MSGPSVRTISLDDYLEKLVEACDSKDPGDTIAKIQALIHHLMGQVNKENMRIAEASRKAEVEASIACMRSRVAVAFTFVASGLMIANSMVSIAPKELHALASKVCNLDRFDMTNDAGLKGFMEFVSQHLSAATTITEKVGDTVKSRVEANRVEYQAAADRNRDIQNDCESTSKDERNRADSDKSNAQEREQSRHRVLSEIMNR